MIRNCLEGCVESISSAGDLITDISVQGAQEAPNLHEVKIQVGPHETIGIYTPDHNEPDGTLIAIQNAEGLIEVGITGMNISEMLGIQVGEKVTLSW